LQDFRLTFNVHYLNILKAFDLPKEDGLLNLEIGDEFTNPFQVVKSGTQFHSLRTGFQSRGEFL